MNIFFFFFSYSTTYTQITKLDVRKDNYVKCVANKSVTDATHEKMQYSY